MSVSNPQQYLNDLGGFRNQIGNKVEAYKNKQDLVNLGVGKLKSKALQKAQDLMKQGQNLVSTAYESQGGAAAAGVLAKGGKKAASFVKGKIQERLAQREGAANNQGNQQQGIDRQEEKGTEMDEMKSNVGGEERGSMPKNVPDRAEMDEDFAGYESKDAGAGETEGAESKVATEDDAVGDAVEGAETAGGEAGEVGGEVLAGEAAAEGLGDAAAATSWIPIVGEIFAGAAAAAGIGVGVAGLVEEAQGGDAEKKAENMTDTAPKAAAVNVAGTYVTPTRSSLMV